MNFKKFLEMTNMEAYKVLLLNKHATKEEIIQSHRKLMKIHHPDIGGNREIASKLNQAKDVLLKDPSLAKVISDQKDDNLRKKLFLILNSSYILDNISNLIHDFEKNEGFINRDILHKARINVIDFENLVDDCRNIIFNQLRYGESSHAQEIIQKQLDKLNNLSGDLILYLYKFPKNINHIKRSIGDITQILSILKTYV